MIQKIIKPNRRKEKPFLLLLLLMALNHMVLFAQEPYQKVHGALTLGDVSIKQLSLVFTGHEFAEGGYSILQTLEKEDIPASFFFTGVFYQNPTFQTLIREIKEQGHYLGAHSDQHLLYCDWEDREKLLVTQRAFTNDLMANYERMGQFGITKKGITG